MTKVNKTDEEWKQELSPEQFHVCRKGGTERAFSWSALKPAHLVKSVVR